jgi:hypothetical protein
MVQKLTKRPTRLLLLNSLLETFPNYDIGIVINVQHYKSTATVAIQNIYVSFEAAV